MKSKEEREWDKIWGNAGLNEEQLFDKVILILEQQSGYISGGELFNALFGNATGDQLEHIFKRVLTQLIDDGFVSILEIGNVNIAYASKSYKLTGKGMKLANAPLRIFKHKPYTYNNWVTGIESAFSKYLPIIISILALIVSIITCNRTK